MSGYDWQPEQYDAAERAREWDRADDRERAEELQRDRVTRDVGERGCICTTGRELCSNARCRNRVRVAPTMHEGEA